MIKATFDKGARTAAARGAVQYDSGQTIYLYGIEEKLSGQTVEMHFAYAGDAKTETRMAAWDAKEKAWKASVPNKYLTAARAVNAYLYARKSEDEARTVYTAVFTPVGRPAPSDGVTEEEKSAWGELVAEVNAKIAEMEQAVSRANGAAQSVTAAIGQLDNDKTAWEARIKTAEKEASDAKSAAEAIKDKTKGAVYEISRDTVEITASGWTQNESGLYEKEIAIAEMKTNLRLRWSVGADAIGVALVAGVKCESDGTATVVCMSEPEKAFEMTFAVEGVRE